LHKQKAENFNFNLNIDDFSNKGQKIFH